MPLIESSEEREEYFRSRLGEYTEALELEGRAVREVEEVAEGFVASREVLPVSDYRLRTYAAAIAYIGGSRWRGKTQENAAEVADLSAHIISKRYQELEEDLGFSTEEDSFLSVDGG